MTRQPRRWNVLGAAGLAMVLGGCTVNVNTEGSTATETRKFTVSGPPQVTLDTFNGAIEVHSWDRPEIEVVVDKQAQDDALLSEIAIEQTQDGNRVSLTVRGPSRREISGIVIGVSLSPRAKLRVALPKASSLVLRSGDGAITVEDITGTVSMRTDDGSIVAMRVTGELTARTDDGSIRLREVAGKVDVESLDGSIVVGGVVTHLRVKTNDGSVRVAAESGSAVAADWSIESGDGSVEIRLPAGVNAEIDASTADGSVRSNYPGLSAPSAGDDGDERRRRSLKATLGAGGHSVRVRTGDGSIRFES